jgi:hypothetical protein
VSGPQIVAAVLSVIAIRDEAIDELLSIDTTQRGIGLRGNRAEVGKRLIAPLLEVLLILVLAEIVIFRGAGNVAIPGDRIDRVGHRRAASELQDSCPEDDQPCLAPHYKLLHIKPARPPPLVY